MKRFFRGPVKRLTVSNIRLLDNGYTCNKKIDIVKDKELFFENFFGKILRKKDRYPMILESELHDMIDYYGENGYKRFSTEYIDRDELEQIEVTYPKHLIKKNNPKK